MFKSKKRLIITGIIIITISLMIEIFGFNFNFFVKGNQPVEVSKITTENLMALDDGHYKILENGANIRLEGIGQYINRLEFNTDSFDNNINIQITYNDNVKTDNINAIDQKSIYINDSVDSIQLSFMDGKGQEIKIDDFQGVNDFQFNPFRFLMLVLFFILVGVVGDTISKKGDIKLEAVFLVLILCFGFLNTIMTPIFYSWDEAEHFIKAYNLASNNVVMRGGEAVFYPSDLKEFFDKRHEIENPNYRTFEEYNDVTQKLLTIDYSDTERVYYPSTAITYTFIPYLFSSIGVMMGKIFGFPFLISFYLGRFFNLLIYAILVFFSIKIIPFGKKLLFVCALLPTIVFQAASYSADVVINGFSFFVFALIMKWLFEEKKLSIPDLLIMCGCFILITASKMAYVPIFLLVLLLRPGNFGDHKKGWIIKLSVLFLACLTFIGVYIYGAKIGIAQWTIPGVDVKEQILFIIHNPLNFIGVIIRTIMTQKEYLLGGASVTLAYIGYLGRDVLIIVYFVLALITWIDTDKNVAMLKMKDRGIILLMCLLTIGLSMTALYATFTPVGSTTVLGFQGRYLIPLMFPFLFLFQRKTRFSSIKSEITNIIAVTFTTCILFTTIIHVYSLYYI